MEVDRREVPLYVSASMFFSAWDSWWDIFTLERGPSISDPRAVSNPAICPSGAPLLLSLSFSVWGSSEPCVADETQARRVLVSGESGRHTARRESYHSEGAGQTESVCALCPPQNMFV